MAQRRSYKHFTLRTTLPKRLVLYNKNSTLDPGKRNLNGSLLPRAKILFLVTYADRGLNNRCLKGNDYF